MSEQTVKLSPHTLSVLSNFSTFSPSIWFKAGNVIKTRSTSREVYAIAELTEDIPKDFSVYDLQRLLNCVKLFDGGDTELKFDEIDNGVVIGSGRNKIRYIFSDPIIMPQNCVTVSDYDKNPRLPPIIGNFTLKSEILDKVKKGATVLGSPNISIVSDGSTVKLVAHDKGNSLSDRFEFELESADVSKKFTVDLKIETLRFIAGEYTVSVAERIAVHFKNNTVPVEYYISCQITQD